MKKIDSISEMQKISEELRASGKTIAFVPTMGFLHEGHLELMREGNRRSDILIASIFINPTQFGFSEDLDAYPRDMEGDFKKAKSAGTDFIFIPSVKEMYPKNFQTTINLKSIINHLCGLSRPGHFDGVATVIAKFFNIMRPHIAIFGQKDFQQLAVIRCMVKDLNLDIEIIGHQTVREDDGLAMSSRNSYLNSKERISALCLKKSLDLSIAMVNGGVTETLKIKSAIEKLISTHSFTEIDYIAICDPETMEDINIIEGEALFALAVYIGKTRLIDNCLLNA